MKGKLVYLRPLEHVDVDFLFRVVNNDLEARRLTGTQRYFTIQETEEYVANNASDKTRAGIWV